MSHFRANSSSSTASKASSSRTVVSDLTPSPAFKDIPITAIDKGKGKAPNSAAVKKAPLTPKKRKTLILWVLFLTFGLVIFATIAVVGVIYWRQDQKTKWSPIWSPQTSTSYNVTELQSAASLLAIGVGFSAFDISKGLKVDLAFSPKNTLTTPGNTPTQPICISHGETQLEFDAQEEMSPDNFQVVMTGDSSWFPFDHYSGELFISAHFGVPPNTTAANSTVAAVSNSTSAAAAPSLKARGDDDEDGDAEGDDDAEGGEKDEGPKCADTPLFISPAIVGSASGFTIWADVTPGYDETSPGNKDYSTAMIRFTARRTKVHVGFSILMFIIMWLMSLIVLLIAFVVHKSGKRAELGLCGVASSLLYSLPRIRETQPGIPKMGIIGDMVGYLWNMLIVAICVVSLLLNYILRRGQKRWDQRVEKNTDAEASKPKEMDASVMML